MSRINRSSCVVGVTGVGGPAGFAVLRAVADAGYATAGYDADPLAAGLRFAGVSRTLPSADAPDFRASLLEVVRTDHLSVLISTVVEEFGVVTSLVSELGRLGCRTWLPDNQTVEFCSDKEAFATHLRSFGIPHPATARTPEGAAALPGPWILKPRRGRGSRGLIFVDQQIQLLNALRNDPTLIAQTRASGNEFTADALVDHDHALIACVPRWRIETKAGISTKGMTFASAAVTVLCNQTLQALGLTGPANVQGFVDANGAIVIIEVNPRFSGGLPLTLAAGANTVAAYLEGILDPSRHLAPLAFRPGVLMIRYFSEVIEFTE